MKPSHDLPGTGRATLKDPEFPGLELRGNLKGASWTLRHRVEGKRIRDPLGRWPGLTVNAARKAAHAKLASVAVTKAAGEDVLAQRAERKRLKQAKTFNETLTEYVQQRRDLRTIDHAEKVIRNVFASQLGEKLPNLSKSKLLACTDKHRQTSASVADLSIRYLRPFLKWAYERGHVSADLLTLRVGQTRKRDRYLSKMELGALLGTLGSQSEHVGSAAVMMMIATAQRRNEVAGMKWSEVHEDLWIIPAERTKTGKDYAVPLNDTALQTLEIRRVSNTCSDLVFVGATGITPFSGWSSFKSKLDQESSLSDWTFHDLRRTFATLSADAGVDAIIVDRCLNHVGATTLGDVARRYQHSSMLDQKKEAFSTWDGILKSARLDGTI
jgi:integrase